MWNARCTYVHRECTQVKGLFKHVDCIQLHTAFSSLCPQNYEIIFHGNADRFQLSLVRRPKNHLLKINWTCYKHHYRVLTASSIFYEPVPSLSVLLHFPSQLCTSVWPYTSLTWKQQICEKDLWEALIDSSPCKWAAAFDSLGVTLSYPLAWQSRLLVVLPGKPLLLSPVTAFTYRVWSGDLWLTSTEMCSLSSCRFLQNHI